MPFSDRRLVKHVVMHFYFDESGDYAFPEGGFDCYVQAALICPDSSLSNVGEFVAGRCAEWGVAELHALELESMQRQEVADFIGRSDLRGLASHLRSRTASSCRHRS